MMKVSRNMLFGLIFIAVIVGSAIFVFSNLQFFSEKGGEASVLNTNVSPNGNHVATLWKGMGGGAAGWCFQRVSVYRGYRPFDLEKERATGNFVFSASCRSNISMEWRSENELHITYTMDNDGVSVKQKPKSDYNSSVKVTYSLKDETVDP